MQTMLNLVVCCCALLGVVPQSLKPVKILSQQLPVPIFLLFHDRRCWNNVGSMLDPSSHLFQHCCCWPRMRITQGYTPFRDHPTMHCRSQHCWELLHPFAHHCCNERNNSQHCLPNNFGSCCVRLQVALRNSTIIFVCNLLEISESLTTCASG